MPPLNATQIYERRFGLPECRPTGMPENWWFIVQQRRRGTPLATIGVALHGITKQAVFDHEKRALRYLCETQPIAPILLEWLLLIPGGKRPWPQNERETWLAELRRRLLLVFGEDRAARIAGEPRGDAS